MNTTRIETSSEGRWGRELAAALAFARRDWERTKEDWRAFHRMLVAMHEPPAFQPVKPHVLQGYHPRSAGSHPAHHAWTLRDPHHGGFAGHRENQ